MTRLEERKFQTEFVNLVIMQFNMHPEVRSDSKLLAKTLIESLNLALAFKKLKIVDFGDE